MVTSELQMVRQAVHSEQDLRHKLEASTISKLQEHTTSNKMTKYFHKLLLKLQKEKTNMVGWPLLGDGHMMGKRCPSRAGVIAQQ